MKNIFGIDGLAITEYAISANAILGIRDSGKTYTATEASEELYDAKPNIPFVWLDPIGVAHNLRIPGKGRGYPVVVAGGRHGDLPLTVQNSGEILRAALRSGVSLVIDLFSVQLSKADWRRIVRQCCEILLYENTDFGLRHLFIEEAAEFVPQKPMDYDVFSAVEKLVRMGGNSKVGVTLINQRSADLNKSVLELCANVFVHRQKGKNTLLDLKKWFTLLDLSDAEQNRIADSLPNLKSGECWALLNDLPKPIHLRIPEKNSLHPDRRAVVSSADLAKRKPVPADRFVADMTAALPKLEEERKASDPKVLTARIADLEKQLKAGTSAPVEKINTAAIEAAARAEGYAQGFRDGDEAGWAGGSYMTHRLWVAGVKALTIEPPQYVPQEPPKRFTPAKASVLQNQASHPKQIPQIASVAQPVERRASIPKAAGSTPAGRSSSVVSGAQRQVLSGLAWWNAMGHREVTRAQLAGKIGWKVGGSHLRNRLAELSTAGLIAYPRTGYVALTDDGLSTAPEPDLNSTLRESIRASLSGAQTVVFDVLTHEAQERERIAALIGWESGGSHLRNRLAELSALELICYPIRGQVALQEWVR